MFSVQYHPEASPGPRDSHYLFKRFAGSDAGEQAGVSAGHPPSSPGQSAKRGFAPDVQASTFFTHRAAQTWMAGIEAAAMTCDMHVTH